MKIALPSLSASFWLPSNESPSTSDRLFLLFGASSSNQATAVAVISAVPWKVAQLDHIGALENSIEDALALLPAGCRFVGFAQLKRQDSALLPTAVLLAKYAARSIFDPAPLVDLLFHTSSDTEKHQSSSDDDVAVVVFDVVQRGTNDGAAVEFTTLEQQQQIRIFEIVDTNPIHTVKTRHLNSTALVLDKKSSSSSSKKDRAFIIHPGNGAVSSSSSSLLPNRTLNSAVFAIAVVADERQETIEKTLLQSWREYVARWLEDEDARLEREAEEAAERGLGDDVSNRKRVVASTAKWLEASPTTTDASTTAAALLRVRVDALLPPTTSVAATAAPSAAVKSVVESVTGLRLVAKSATRPKTNEQQQQQQQSTDKKQNQNDSMPATTTTLLAQKLSNAPTWFWLLWVLLVVACIVLGVVWEQRPKSTGAEKVMPEV